MYYNLSNKIPSHSQIPPPLGREDYPGCVYQKEGTLVSDVPPAIMTQLERSSPEKTPPYFALYFS